jgi:hypothetical protein
MSFESCFGGFAGSKSSPVAMGGLPTFDNPMAQGLRMKDAGEDLLHVSVIPCGHFATPLEAGL